MRPLSQVILIHAHHSNGASQHDACRVAEYGMHSTGWVLERAEDNGVAPYVCADGGAFIQSPPRTVSCQRCRDCLNDYKQCELIHSTQADKGYSEANHLQLDYKQFNLIYRTQAADRGKSGTTHLQLAARHCLWIFSLRHAHWKSGHVHGLS
jgi:hypothetical protein